MAYNLSLLRKDTLSRTSFGILLFISNIQLRNIYGMGRKKALYEKVSWFLPFVEWPSHKDIKSFLTSILFCILTHFKGNNSTLRGRNSKMKAHCQKLVGINFCIFDAVERLLILYLILLVFGNKH